MARFFFRLERVLSVRRHEEEREKLRFASAVQNWQSARDRVMDIDRRLASALEAEDATGKVSTLDRLVQAYDYRTALHAQKTRAEIVLSRMTEELNLARETLIAARQRRRALEQLRERHWEKWKKIEEDQEQNELDEIGLQSFRRAAAADAASAADFDLFSKFNAEHNR